eukprot:4063827-Amphidinium_carterae.1
MALTVKHRPHRFSVQSIKETKRNNELQHKGAGIHNHQVDIVHIGHEETQALVGPCSVWFPS